VIEPLLTARQLAGVLGVSPATVLDWFEDGRLPGFRLSSRAVRFRESEVVAWLEERRATQNAARTNRHRQRPAGVA
jgi:excisionase family DNA binding protein